MNVNSLNRVKTIGKIDGYVEAMLNNAHGNIATFANQFNRDVKIAQKDSRVFVNSGTITSSFDYKKMQRATDFQTNIINNIVANQHASEKSLKDGFSIIV